MAGEAEMMEKAEVFSFDDIANFASYRAKKSAQRNDPWAWAYWRSTAEWASFAVADPLLADSSLWPQAVEVFMTNVQTALEDRDYVTAAREYAHAKWLRILSVNNKWGIVKPLSLNWLKGFEKSPEMSGRKEWDPRGWQPSWGTLENAVRSAFLEVYGVPQKVSTITDSIVSSTEPRAVQAGWTERNPNVVLVFTEYDWVRDPWTPDTTEEHNRWEQAMKLLEEHGFNTWHESINPAVHVVIREEAP